MIRIIVICSFLSLFFTPLVYAQPQYNPQIGVNIGSFDKITLDSTEFSGHVGWNIGIDVRHSSRMFALTTGAHFYQQAVDVSGKVNQQAYKDGNKVDYLKVPVHADLRLTEEGGLLSLNAFAGPVATLLVGTHSKDNFDFNKSLLKTFQVGAEVGLSADILTFITLAAKYEFGLSSLFKDRNNKMKTLTISAGVRF